MKNTTVSLLLTLLCIPWSSLADEAKYNISLRKTHPSLPRENVIVLTHKGMDSYLMLTDLINISSQRKLENDLRELLSIGLIGEMLVDQNHYTDLDEYESMTFEQIIANRQRHITNFTRFTKSYNQYSQHVIESFLHLSNQRNSTQKAIEGIEELNSLMANTPVSGASPNKLASWQAPRDRFSGLVSINIHAERSAKDQARLFSRNISNAVKSSDYQAYGSNFMSLLELRAASNSSGAASDSLDDLHRHDFFMDTPIFELVQRLFITPSVSQGQNLSPEIKLAINQIGIIARESRSRWLSAVAGLLYLRSLDGLSGNVDPADIVGLVASQQASTLIANTASIHQITVSDVSSEVNDLVKSVEDKN